MNVILLHNDHRHVSATYVAIFMVVRTRIQIQGVETTPQLKIMNFMHLIIEGNMERIKVIKRWLLSNVNQRQSI